MPRKTLQDELFGSSVDPLDLIRAESDGMILLSREETPNERLCRLYVDMLVRDGQTPEEVEREAEQAALEWEQAR